MLNELKGYDIDFIFKGKHIHTSRCALPDKVSKLRELGLDVFETFEDGEYLIYSSQTKQVFYDSIPYGMEGIEDFFDTTWDFSQVTTINSYFRGHDLSKVDLHDLLFKKAKCLYGLFVAIQGNCINLSDWNLYNTADLGNMFSCSEVKRIYLDNWNMQNVVSTSGMFSECAAEAISFNGWKNFHPVYINGMFTRSHIKSLKMCNWDLSKCKDASLFITACENLESIEFCNCSFGLINAPDFIHDCNELKTVKFNECIFKSYKTLDIGKHCPNLKQISYTDCVDTEIGQFSTLEGVES